MMKHSLAQHFIKYKKIALVILMTCLLPSYLAHSGEVKNANKKSQITVYNDLAIERKNETVTVSLEKLPFSEQKSWSHIVVTDLSNNESLMYQLIVTKNSTICYVIIVSIN